MKSWKNSMYNFIFVCYNHGAGGENLAVKISKNKYCNTLAYDKMGYRTWSYDIFDKFFLKPFNKDWQDKLKQVTPTKFVDVVPSHYPPSELKKKFPNELYVVINYPTTTKGVEEFKKAVYQKVWLSQHNTLQQKVGYWQNNTSKALTRENLKKISKQITNGGIECIINNIPINEKNTKLLFERKIFRMKDKFNLKQDENILVTSYENLSNIKGLLKLIDTRLTGLEK
tara:strand:- start:110 stop:790 length:681 start_codon:yes stop_codon:yes gene_type:complete